MSSETPEPEDPLDQAYPPLDVIGSRWWYWIAIYPLVMVLIVPVIILSVVLFTFPLTVVASGAEASAGPGPLMIGFGLLVGIIVLVVILLAFLSTVLLPVALYLDARAVSRADLEWEPDPILYGLLGLLPYVATPLAGIIVCVYYLFKRHEHVGVP